MQYVHRKFAAVGDRDPKVVGHPAEGVDQRPMPGAGTSVRTN
jgi:hypothetical protein